MRIAQFRRTRNVLLFVHEAERVFFSHSSGSYGTAFAQVVT